LICLRLKKLSQIVFFLYLTAGSVGAREIACPSHFAAGEAPEIINSKLQQKIQVLCFEGYALLHSGVSRTPLWSAEDLTPARLKEAKHLKRKNAFHSEDQLQMEDRSELHDYARSGFDRGHMSPSGDMPTATAQFESFSLANMVPQNPNNNQNLWEGIESSVRYLTSRRSELFVITGPVFDESPVKRLNGRVFIPSHIFKAVYDPEKKEAGAYIAPNAPGMDYQTVSIAELEKRIGINLFPKMPQKVKEKKMDLPEPKPHGHKGGRGRHQGISDN
jgi:endonuclease G, mitochondrial